MLTERAGRFVELPGSTPVDDPLAWMSARLKAEEASTDGDLPFCGGLAGMLAFEFAWHLDDVRAPRRACSTPDMWVGEFDSALVFDHHTRRWWLTGAPDSQAASLLRRAVFEPAAEASKRPRGCGFHLTVSPETYAERVQRAIDAVYAGELFEVNYTERFGARWPGEAFALYDGLRQKSTGPYGAFLDAGDFQLASISPEQFLQVDDRHVVTRPIKGTRPRGTSPTEDARLAQELLTSVKDRAENIMIVDLMRNDLTRICELGSVEATEVCGLHSFAGVHHLVSTVEGDLADGFSALDALVASFPPGSITGAPKLRSIELIAELEETARGPYTGSLFYASRHGRLDSNVLIRTAVVEGDAVRYGAGGAVVADSHPRAEYDEACVKAGPLEQVICDD